MSLSLCSACLHQHVSHILLATAKPNLQLTMNNVPVCSTCDYKMQTATATVSIPAAAFGNNPNAVVSVIRFADSTSFYDRSLSSSGRGVNSGVVSVGITANDLDTAALAAPFQYELPAKNTSLLQSPSCVYFDLELTNTWQSKGCTLISTAGGRFVCSCTHMTNFAVLTSLQPTEVVNEPILTYITYVGVGISIPCLLLLVITFIAFRQLMNMHRFIVLNIAVTLGIALTVFVFFIDMTSSMLCTPAAVTMHYTLLCAFFWMLMDGFHLWRTFVLVFVTSFRRRDYLLRTCLCYGTPAVIVGLSYGLLQSSYRRDNACWLSQGNLSGFCGLVSQQRRS
jgi:hypothetical protein